ncbi:MAG: serine hydrolase domain-containing protein [Byssovorax sp.]
MTAARPLVRLDAAAHLCADDLKAAPAAVTGAAVRRGDAFVHGLGAAGRLWGEDDAPAATTETIFDLASVTKPLTALALARLEKQGLLHRSERLGDILPELAGTPSAGLPLDLFAAHRAGLDGHRPLYAPLVEGKPVDPAASRIVAASARREGCAGEPPDAEGFEPVYSDLGYLLLGEAIARRGGDDLDRVIEREVIDPLDLGAIGSARRLRERLAPGAFDARVAPTEVVAWRGGTIRGAVHDENAWALSADRCSGHAGLFGDARAVVLLGAAILDALAGRRPGWLGPDDLAPLVRPRPGGSLLAGFDHRSGDTPSSGARFGPRTFGHLGFTGTALWIDPDAELAGVLLTNRVHPTRETLLIRKARPLVFDAIADAMLSSAPAVS